MSSSAYATPGLRRATLGYGVSWGITWLAWLAWRDMPLVWSAVVFAASVPLGIAWLRRIPELRRQTPWRASLVSTGVGLAWWQLAVFASDACGFDGAARTLYQIGLGSTFLVGLGWVVWWVERRARACDERRWQSLDLAERERQLERAPKPLVDDQQATRHGPRIWNPLDPQAWYYGRRGRRLNQSLSVLAAYSFLFLLVVTLLSQTRGCEEIYELPAGGGKQTQMAQTVRVQRVIRKKFVVNPFSGIKFEVPPIDDVKLQLTEVTQHSYAIGQGEGTGAGYAGGTGQGRVRLIRLEYAGGDWDLNFGVGADLNMLVEYGVRTQQKIAEQTESRTVLDLKSFPVGKSPPLVFLTGQKSVSLSNVELKTLREYLLDKHGMLFVSNGGSGQFHQQILALMNQVVPEVRPVPVPLDDTIHSLPYRLHSVPIVAPHGGREALGWYKDGRWICYYHPGDISDAWCDDHAGVTPDVWEACYQLGVNVINYANAEYDKWNTAQRKK